MDPTDKFIEHFNGQLDGYIIEYIFQNYDGEGYLWSNMRDYSKFDLYSPFHRFKCFICSPEFTVLPTVLIESSYEDLLLDITPGIFYDGNKPEFMYLMESLNRYNGEWLYRRFISNAIEVGSSRKVMFRL